MRGALDFAAAAWLPAASPFYMALVDVELLTAARAVTGCPASTPAHALMAEAGLHLQSADARRTALATRMLAMVAYLPTNDPYHVALRPWRHHADWLTSADGTTSVERRPTWRVRSSRSSQRSPPHFPREHPGAG